MMLDNILFWKKQIHELKEETDESIKALDAEREQRKKMSARLRAIEIDLNNATRRSD